jgi:hypothetical protein
MNSNHTIIIIQKWLDGVYHGYFWPVPFNKVNSPLAMIFIALRYVLQPRHKHSVQGHKKTALEIRR